MKTVTVTAPNSFSNESWHQLHQEAEEIIQNEPILQSFIQQTILSCQSLAEAVANRIAFRLAHPVFPKDVLFKTFQQILNSEPNFHNAIISDLDAIRTRDPACQRLIEPVLYFKGFHAIQTHRYAHWLWNMEQKDFALYLQSRSSEVFQTDIHPAARIGKGILLDHATGLVVGSTAVIDDNVSMLQNVTLGGTGKERGDRHPKIRCGVLIGAGATILGNIEIGHCSRVAAGSVVLKTVPPHTTVAGIPAKVIGVAGSDEPSCTMDHTFTAKKTSTQNK